MTQAQVAAELGIGIGIGIGIATVKRHWNKV